MSGFEAFTTGQARPAVPGFLLGGAEAAAAAVDAPSAAAAGLIPAQDAAMEALGTAGFAMGAGGAAVRPAGSVGVGGRVASAGNFEDYLRRVNPQGLRVDANDRPNLMMGDMYGMLPRNARKVSEREGVSFYQAPDGAAYATAFNPDVGEMDVVGYAMPRGDMTDLAVVGEMRGRGIGSELQYLMRSQDPYALTGGLTEAGEASLRRTYNRLRDEGIVAANADKSTGLLAAAAAETPTGIRAYQGSPHDFNAERLVRYPDGRTEYIVGRPDVLPDVPSGSEVLQDFPMGRMRMDKIGTGEGAQAYGHGLYAAEAEGVARGYRDALSDRDAPLGTFVKPSGDTVDVLDAPDGFYSLLGEQPDNTSYDQLLKAAQDKLEWAQTRKGGLRDELTRKAQKVLDFVKENDGVRFERNPARGRMYEVNINANPEDFLDWDKPLSEQPKVAERLGYSDPVVIAAEKARLRGLFSAPKGDTFEDLFGPLTAQEKAAAERLAVMPEPWKELTGKDGWFRAAQRRFSVMGDDGRWGPGAKTYEEALQMAGGDINKVRTMSDPSAPARAEFMREAGIPGIKYFDAMSRNAGEGSRNFVVFDENLINIVRKYGIAGAAAVLGVSVADVEAAMAQGQPAPRTPGLLVQ